jgi:hypothetical protein
VENAPSVEAGRLVCHQRSRLGEREGESLPPELRLQPGEAHNAGVAEGPRADGARTRAQGQPGQPEGSSFAECGSQEAESVRWRLQERAFAEEDDVLFNTKSLQLNKPGFRKRRRRFEDPFKVFKRMVLRGLCGLHARPHRSSRSCAAPCAPGPMAVRPPLQSHPHRRPCRKLRVGGSPGGAGHRPSGRGSGRPPRLRQPAGPLQGCLPHLLPQRGRRIQGAEWDPHLFQQRQASPLACSCTARTGRPKASSLPC